MVRLESLSYNPVPRQSSSIASIIFKPLIPFPNKHLASGGKCQRTEISRARKVPTDNRFLVEIWRYARMLLSEVVDMEATRSLAVLQYDEKEAKVQGRNKMEIEILTFNCLRYSTYLGDPQVFRDDLVATVDRRRSAEDEASKSRESDR